MDNTKICRVKRSRKQLGVGLFVRSFLHIGDFALTIYIQTPKRWLSTRWEDHPYFNVTVFLPRNAKMNTFETDVPNYSHTISDLEGRVSFESLALKSNNGAISGEVSYRLLARKWSLIRCLVHRFPSGLDRNTEWED